MTVFPVVLAGDLCSGGWEGVFEEPGGHSRTFFLTYGRQGRSGVIRVRKGGHQHGRALCIEIYVQVFWGSHGNFRCIDIWYSA